MIQIVAASCVLAAYVAHGFQVPSSRAQITSLNMALSDYKNELAATAKQIAAPGQYSKSLYTYISIELIWHFYI